MKPSIVFVSGSIGLLLAMPLTQAAPAGGPTAILVDQGAQAGWQDLAFLAAVPATRQANQGDGAAIALEADGQLPREVADYLGRLKPGTVYHLGEKPLPGQHGEPRELNAKSADQAAIELAKTFWKTNPRAVLCRDDDYGSALIASTMAARLRAPLFFASDSGLSEATSQTLGDLGVREPLFVGKAPAGVKATELKGLEDVVNWLRSQGMESTYLAVANVRDRTDTTIRKLSLAAPMFAAAHDGMVVPIDDFIQWRAAFKGTPITGNLPKGITAGVKPSKAGTIKLPEGNIPFVFGYGNEDKQFRLWLDLDGNGTFDGPNEGPLTRNGVVTLLGKPRTIDLGVNHAKPCDVSVTTGSAEEVIDRLHRLYGTIGTPKYLCLVGLPDAIPQAIMNRGNGDMTSDHPYGNTDDDLFAEIAVGRVIGESATFATLHASRTVTYDRLLDPSWAGRAGQARWEKSMGDAFVNVGLDASAYHDKTDLPAVLATPGANNPKPTKERSFGEDSPLTRVAFLSHSAHSWWKEIGETYDMHSRILLAPTVAESGGCLTCALDYEPGFQSVVSRLFRNGAVSFSGQTRPGIARQEQQRIEFWNGVLAGETLGEAHLRAQNSKAALVLETNQINGGHDHYQLYIRSLMGDPAFRPRLPSTPKTSPAKVEAKGDLVTVHAPQTWWVSRMRVPEDWKLWAEKPLYVIRGLGTYPDCIWCKEKYNHEVNYVDATLTTKRRISSITQTTPDLPATLGWTGKYTVDEHADGSRTYHWRVRLVDFDQTTGTINHQADKIDYKIGFSD